MSVKILYPLLVENTKAQIYIYSEYGNSMLKCNTKKNLGIVYLYRTTVAQSYKYIHLYFNFLI